MVAPPALAFSPSEALEILVERLRDKPGGYGRHGYGVDLTAILEAVAKERGVSTDPLVIGRALPPFYDAAWELCRKGILRPSVSNPLASPWDAGQSGDGYTLTASGEQWLAELGDLQFIPMGMSRTSAMLRRFAPRFGPGYDQRSQEAVRCYFAGAHLACCAMAGAAAESILLATAIAQGPRPEEQVLTEYLSSGGRRRIESRVVGQTREPIASRILSFMDLLNYWRDSSAHGVASSISEIESFDAISRLLRFAHLVEDHWGLLAR